MKRIFLLSGENLDLAREEVIALTGNTFDSAGSYKMVDNLLILDADFKFSRLALTRKVYDYLFECSYKDLEKKMASFDWQSVYNKSFSLHITNVGNFSFHEKEAHLAKYIWNKVRSPRVDLDFSQTRIEILVTDKKIFVGKCIMILKQEFHKRRPSVRPERHPTTINPKFARAMINLTGIPTGKAVVDPFCGTGGILIEAGLMRFKTYGYDISPKMIEKAYKNLTYFKIRRFELEEFDATSLRKPVDYVVTDLPYGRGSKVSKDLKKLYLDFLHTLTDILRYKAVLVFPDFVDHKSLIAQASLKIEKEFSLYVHKNLTRNIVLLSKKKG